MMSILNSGGDNRVSWYVLHSKPRKENQVYSYLRANDIEVFYPTIRIKPVNPRSLKIRPYFPGYLFVHVSLNDVGVSALQWIPGATGLVSFGGSPACVPDAFMHDLKCYLADLKVVNEAKRSHFKPGEPVRITDGPFAGYEALFDQQLNDEERVQVLLDCLGRRVKVKVNANAITR